MFMHEPARKAMNRAIFISGNARSGTTVLGKIIHSFSTVEYTFEPPFLFSLLPQINELPPDQFKTMFEAYCFEDILLGLLAGRTLNFNSNDDSYVYLSKSKEEIEPRLQKGWSKKNIMQASETARLCIKMPDIGNPLHKLTEYYPEMAVVVTHRRANPVIESILKKNWYSNESLSERTVIWPSQTSSGIVVPLWVESEFISSWKEWSELERAGYYYVRIASELSKIKNGIFFSYEKMIENPKESISNLAEKLNLKFGSKTKSLLEAVELKSPQSENWIAKLPTELGQKVLEFDSL